MEHHGTTMNSEVKENCLNLLDKHDPNFVKDWKDKNEDTNTAGKNTDEPKPTN